MTEEEVRQIVREEISSMAGLVLRRSQEENFTRSGERNMAQDVVNDTLATQVPGIYAFGECAEHRGKMYGIVAPVCTMR